ncbi:hypothetical protein GRJ2_000695000 [Grus japonensis]|uniref:Uncharacterized protein n=1 Tax=Grus japonensis TaxID=30415 RepID=A0ABC9WBA4_GRUJA
MSAVLFFSVLILNIIDDDKLKHKRLQACPCIIAKSITDGKKQLLRYSGHKLGMNLILPLLPIRPQPTSERSE